MPPLPPDDPFDRLRDADPAAGAEPDVDRLNAAVAARTGDLAAAPVDELAARRRRLPMGARWFQVAAGVAALAIVGTGSFALGAGQSGSDQVAAGSPIPAAIDLGGAVAESGAGAPASADSAAMKADGRMSMGFGGRTVFTGSGLSTDGGTATAWGFDAEATFASEGAARIAEALGVTGEPVQEWGSWQVGPNDGTAPMVQVQPDGLTSVNYYDPTVQAGQCVDTSTSMGGAADAPSGSAVEIAPAPAPATCTGGEPAPGADQAIERTREVLRTIGVDDTAYDFALTESWTTELASVSAELLLDGQRTGVAWNVTLAAGGVVQSLYGTLAPTVELGALDIISPADAVARLTDPRFGSTWGGIMPLARTAGLAAEPDLAIMPVEPDFTVPPTPRAGAQLPWAVTEVTLTSARLGLGLTTLDNGATVLLPSYELSDDSGTTWSVVAVADAHLDFAPAG
ncbi:hypothetical protein QUV83_16050 [Cellulomonas cellasea]|uniref:hypothetical protein n=1 Tax=Cellulomonas cellasea TaxID=43670 RepID=UPI0025A3E130|nr:hypothetical protein [Cellulomonas cellasea]MDM8086287.1 hypothetical protein [Cellulomonas cellasea]